MRISDWSSDVCSSDLLAEPELVPEARSAKAGRKVESRRPRRGPQVGLIAQASRNAEEALERHLAERTTQGKTLRELSDLFELEAPPKRIEVYDDSHIQGTNALGAMIVSGPEGFIKAAYRKLNIKRAATVPGDNFARMREELARRFARLENEATRATRRRGGRR